MSMCWTPAEINIVQNIDHKIGEVLKPSETTMEIIICPQLMKDASVEQALPTFYKSV